ncbi:uncharacterized protein N7482_006297 [Penicillium canariense]|uniref:Uncharacterized protein n=1 Tax=Penicillium canariense TaxID=189055 RepID=A0A9W9LNU5_9EURO|nr:uncharacterized protein N7482_006297 [Penicillium canariense]KAJ5167516.1 hypothetical protein N7482_006297 [Penicillium canariense]
MASVIGRKAVQGIAAGIGLVSEVRSAHKAKKQNHQGQTGEEADFQTERRLDDEQERHDEPPLYSVDGEGAICPGSAATASLEEQWALDEAQEELLHSTKGHLVASESKKSQDRIDEAGLAHRFASAYPAPPPYSLIQDAPLPQLPAPVVLPQRRPKNRERGFIRAYAPVLNDCGIDQDMFIDFLNTAEKACQASPWLNAINLASIGTMWLPSITGIAVSIAIQIATDVAIAVEGRRKTNTFFNKINKEFFQPRGLYCLIMTWNPELPDAPSTTIDLNSLLSKAAGGGGSDMLGRLRHRFKSSDGEAYGNIFPEVAPLIFPEIDQLASDQDAEKKLAKMKKKKEFVAGYMDKRAQARFAAKNPDSYLSQGPKPTFTSRYADPNHPASSGDPLALVTGGHFTMGKLNSMNGRGSREALDPYSARRDLGSNPPAPHQRPFGLFDAISTIRDLRKPQNSASLGGSGVDTGGRGLDRIASRRAEKDNIGPLTPLAKLLKKKVLYLAIVNMPSEDEMSRAREALGQAP